MKMDKRYLILICIVVIFLSVSTVNAASTTGNTSSNTTTLTGNSSVNDNSVMKSSTQSVTSKSNFRDVKEIKITDKSYSSYFNVYTGNILPSADIIPGDTLRIGNVTDKAFTIDRKLTITTINDGDQITNGVIRLIAGSDGSIITGLKIRNNKVVYTVNGIAGVILDGIRLTNSSHNTISYNDVELSYNEGAYVMPMDWSNHNTIVYNRLSSGLTSCMPMSESHYNDISHNQLEVRGAKWGVVGNIIYFNPYGRANYGSGLCVGNYISNNYLHSAVISEMIIGMMLTYQSHDNTTIINNTLSHFFSGIVLAGNNTIIQGNHVIDDSYDHAISAVGSNVLVADNVINVKSAFVGIVGKGSSRGSVTIRNNTITLSEGSNYAIDSDDSCNVYGNVVNILNYGVGIFGSGSIINNAVNTNKDTAIKINGNNTEIKGNKITTKSYGIHIISPDVRIYFNSIIDNSIVSHLYGIYLKGLVYNTTISGNVIRTNASVGIFKDITDDFGDDSSDNTINDVIHDATAIMVDDSNFYDYFDEEGYLKFNSFKRDAVIILTHLTGKSLKFKRKVTLLSNYLPNLLSGVTITLYPDASGSIIKDFSFYNVNLDAIILTPGTNNVTISGNNITLLSDAGFTGSLSGVLVYGPCEFVNILKNNIFINSVKGSIYGISVVSYDPATSRFATDFSKHFNIAYNSIILIGDRLAEGLYTDSLIYTNITNNTINIVGGSYGYGIATANVIGSLHDLSITGNTVLINARGMVYLIELHMSDNVTVANNYLSGTGSGVYGISAYRTNNVTIKSNRIHTLGGDLSLTDPGNLDVLGKGNAAIYLTADAVNTNILLNTMYTNAARQMIFDKALDVTLARNSYVIDDENLLYFFTSRSNGVLLSGGLVQANDTLLFADLTRYCSLVFDIPLTLTSYTGGNWVNASFILKSGASNSTISDLIFDLTGKTAITLVDTVNVTVANNKISVSGGSGVTAILIALDSVSNEVKGNVIEMTGGRSLCGIGVSNSYQGRYGRSPRSTLISDNTINVKSTYSANGIYVAMTDNTQILRNKITLVSERIIGILLKYSKDYLSFGTLQTNNTSIINNTIKGTGSLVYMIESRGALNSIVKGNMLTSTSTVSYGYAGFDVNGDLIEGNTILVNGTGNFKGDEISTGQTGVYFSRGSSSNRVVDNYIISSYVPGGDYAVYIAGTSFGFNVVDGNYLISDNDGRTADKAVYALFDVVMNNTPVYIYVSNQGSDTTGDGSKLKPFKSIAHALSQAYNRAVIYLLKGTYHENGLTVDKTITISSFNGEVVLNGGGKQMFHITSTGNLTITGVNITKSGTAFVNHGKLTIKNSNISHNTATDEGGAILNYGDLSLTNSTFSYNIARTGGAISNYGNVSISGCKMNYNSAVRGGVIYSNETGSLKISNSSFEHNSVTDRGGVVDNYGYLDVSGSLFNLNTAKNGGAIFSNSTRFYLLNSTFSYNEASESGGAIHASMTEGIIDLSVFTRNIATSGGALMLSGGDIEITNSVISNNTAAYYGGLYYEGEVEWGHILHQLTINNCDIENNVAMVRGGAFGFAAANVKITNSNIVNNFAPTYSTIYTPNYNINIDARGNYWGPDGPDDSVWNTPNISFREWLRDRVDRNEDKEPDPEGPVPGDDDDNEVPGSGTGPGWGPGSGSGFGFGTGTGPSLIGIGTGTGTVGGGTGSGTVGGGTGSGTGGSGTGSGGGGLIPGNSGNSPNPSGNTNSTAVWNDVGTIGLTAALGYAQAGESGSSGSRGGSSGRAYELDEEKNSRNVEDSDLLAGLVAVLFFMILIAAGYLRNKRSE